MSLSRWKLMAGVLGVTIGGLWLGAALIAVDTRLLAGVRTLLGTTGRQRADQ